MSPEGTGLSKVAEKAEPGPKDAFPGADAAARIFESHYKDDPERPEAETVRDIVNAFLMEQVAQSELRTSEKFGVSYLHSAVSVGDLARRLYEKYGGKVPEVSETQEPVKKTHDEYIFGSFFNPTNPSALYVFYEQGLNKLTQKLPEALEQLARGERPEAYTVHFVGTPTRDIAHMSPEFVKKLEKGNAVDTFGELYAELVGEVAQKTQEDEQRTVTLHGISLGAAFAVTTASALLASGTVTQSPDEMKEKHLPRLMVRLDTPTSQDARSEGQRKWQVPLGFAVNGISAFLRDKSVQASANPFSGNLVKELLPELSRKGIHEEMSPEQKKLKESAIAAVFDHFYKGVPVPPNLQVTEVIGKDDLTMFLPFSSEVGTFRSMLKKRGKEKKIKRASLGRDLALDRKGNRAEENRRVFGVGTDHNIANFRNSSWWRLRRSAQALEDLKTR